MPRIARICAVGYPHHITQRGNNRETVFFDDDDRWFYLKILSEYSHKWFFEIWAYCLMTNHVHILVVPKKEESLARGIGITNLIYTQYINRKYKRSGRLWQNRFFSAVIDKESYLWAVTRYIERNPVRAKHVEKAEDYLWSSAKSHVSGMKDNIISGDGRIDKSELNAYRKYLRHEDKKIEATIRKSTSTGRPIGTSEFIKRLGDILERNILPQKVGRPRNKK